MKILSSLEKAKASKQYKEWHARNKEAYFSFGMTMIENQQPPSWQLGFYQPKEDKIMTFVVDDRTVTMEQEEEIFKKQETQVQPIDIEKVKLAFNKILEAIEALRVKSYSAEVITKTIAILQNLEERGTVWNVTQVTMSLKILNVKVNPETGKVLDHTLQPIIDMVQK